MQYLICLLTCALAAQAGVVEVGAMVRRGDAHLSGCQSTHRR